MTSHIWLLDRRPLSLDVLVRLEWDVRDKKIANDVISGFPRHSFIAIRRHMTWCLLTVVTVVDQRTRLARVFSELSIFSYDTFRFVDFGLGSDDFIIVVVVVVVGTYNKCDYTFMTCCAATWWAASIFPSAAFPFIASLSRHTFYPRVILCFRIFRSSKLSANDLWPLPWDRIFLALSRSTQTQSGDVSSESATTTARGNSLKQLETCRQSWSLMTTREHVDDYF